MNETMGKRIAAGRKRLGLTQDQMAERLGVTAQAVSKWENDQSCPDIAMIPRIAQLFSITTDELLGVQERIVHEATLEPEEAPVTLEAEQKGTSWEIALENSKKGSVGLGIWVLVTGMLLMSAKLLDWQAGFWDILWPTGMMVFGVWGVVGIDDHRLKRFSFFRLALILLGGYYLLNNLGLLTTALNKELIFPACLVLFGLSLLADALQKEGRGGFRVTHNGSIVQSGGEYFEEGESFRCTASFGQNSKVVHLPLVSNGQMEVNFGELRVDLTQCTLKDGCTLDAECSFGELEIILPDSCLVDSGASQAFGSVEFFGSPAPDASTRVCLTGSANFGHVTVRYR